MMSTPLRPTSRRALALLFVALAAALTALGCLRVHRQHRVVELRYQLTEASAELRDKREENRRLRLEVSVLTAPDRIRELAGDMGLEAPAPGQVRRASADGEGPQLGPPAPNAAGEGERDAPAGERGTR